MYFFSKKNLDANNSLFFPNVIVFWRQLTDELEKMAEKLKLTEYLLESKVPQLVLTFCVFPLLID